MGASEETVEDLLAGVFAELSGHLDERQRRLVLGAQARRLGRGGIAMVARAAGVNRKTVARGVDELDGRPGPAGRIRASGAGRRSATEVDSGLERAFWELIDPRMAGADDAPLRWTTSSVRRLTDALTAAGHPVSTWTVRKLLKINDFRLATRRGAETWSVGSRNGQFSYLNEQAAGFLAAGDPVVSLAAWKGRASEIADGSTWPSTARPEDPATDPAGPVQLDGRPGMSNGVSDECRVPVGCDRETAGFAVATLNRWWTMVGAASYPGARRLLVTADSVYSGEHRDPWLRAELGGFAMDTGLMVTVCHLPPGTSRWNRLELQMSDQVALRLRGHLVSSELVVVGVVGGPSARPGLSRSRTDGGRRRARTGRSEQATPAVIRHAWLGDWNYTLTGD